MKPETEKIIREKWIPALRSGKYAQGRGLLKTQYPDDNGPRYCCLGVLCELQELPEYGYQEIWFGDMEDEDNKAMLPMEFAEELDIGAEGQFTPPVLKMGGDELMAELKSLAALNDFYPMSFDQIADFIEESILGPDATHVFLTFEESIGV